MWLCFAQIFLRFFLIKAGCYKRTALFQKLLLLFNFFIYCCFMLLNVKNNFRFVVEMLADSSVNCKINFLNILYEPHHEKNDIFTFVKIKA